MEWPFVARSAEIQQAMDSVEDPSSNGVVFVGEAGVGKTALARQVAERFAERGMRARYVLGTHTSRDVPLAAFAGIVQIPAALEPIRLLAAAHDALDGVDDLLLVVDDAHLLDPLSAIVVHQLAVRGAATLIVTMRSDAEVPDAITALWKDQYLRRIEVGEFSHADTGQLLAATLGGPVAGTVVDQFHELAAGSPLLLRGLLDTALDDGALTDDTGRWRLTHMPRLGSDIEQLLEARVRSLAPSERAVLEIVAAAEVLDWNALRSMCDTDAISDAERHAVIHVISDPLRMRVQVAHPVLADVVRKGCGLARLRQINTSLAQNFWSVVGDLDQNSARDPRLVIELARLMMNSDATPDVDLVIDAAESAMTMSSLSLAEQLARFAYDHGGGLRAAIALADALAWQGSNQEAEDLLSTFDPRDPIMLVRWGCLRATNLFFGCQRRAEAEEVLGTVRSRVTVPALRSYALAVEASIAYFAADLDTAEAASAAVIADPDAMPMAVLWAAVPAAAAANLRGKPEAVAAAAHRGADAARHCASGPQQYAIALSEALSALNQGDIDTASAIVERQRALAHGAPHAEAIVAAMAGRVQLAAGRPQDACEWLQRALSAMVSTLSGGWVPLVATWTVQAEVLRGDTNAAARALSMAESAWGPAVEVFRPLLELARAYHSAATGATADAHSAIERAAAAARGYGITTGELEALHTGLRFGMQPDVARLKALEGQLNTPIANLAARQGEAVVAGDGEELERVAGEWESLGMAAHAADAFTAAALAHRRAGARLPGLQSSTRAHWLVSTFGLHTPATATSGVPLPLSGREREIALLVAGGLSNKQIAERLVVSVRTVEGHLYRIYKHLGINEREQLIRLMRDTDPEAR
ncbi:LuxR C-terminal-related transcriptional regulator [Mycobacterium sp. CVI_P3]|uniref:LuxR C-terminal-related transcriptional regulator n=1 Tax=Mycobacterium pinniadriaticum TaxID=2994102 RepID=A0ABT3SGC9_9MYCO|nr:LuxR family transcriptional regulator [Mycobacterium pinniadriaticum]MCX2932122.1 LuxR C-terminal-related transcriptional regulator [Mycobacterium pinniadriaticum]MCX2938546.1 LuxR C-terminal-related transcriptional regulator [Mycobacterium pinniadriaticum]